MAALFGQNTIINPTIGTVYVYLWVGLVPAAILFGPIYRMCNPLRWIHRALCAAARIDPSRGTAQYPKRLGMWPAAFFLLAFTWLELVNPDWSVDLNVVRWWFGLLTAFTLVGAAIFGDTWFENADPFEVYSSLAARMSPFGRRDDSVLVIRNPLENLDGLTSRYGLVGVVSVMLGSTAFDSFKDSRDWLGWSQQYANHGVLVNTSALVVFCVVVLVTFSLASMATGRIGEVGRRPMPRLLAHSVVPIVIGYVIAHYFSFLISGGISTLHVLGDPLQKGWTLTQWSAGINEFTIFNHPTLIAVIKVVSVIVGHVLGVVSAHDRAIKLLPRKHALTGQLPMLLLMVCYTLTGLWLLFSS